jgi:carbon monoxide dehydrogenase subunit G
MSQLSLTKHIAAPPERVWSILTDLDDSPRTISAITSVERLSADQGLQVGTRWRETRTMFGKEATEVMEVTAVDPGSSYVVEAESGNVHYRSRLSVEPSGEGSVLTMTFHGEPRGALTKFVAATVGKLMQGATRKALAKDLDDIARAAESS